MKNLSTKWKVILCCLTLIVGMASTGITVWAIARNYFNYNAGFEVNITGGRFVNATVSGASYLPGASTPYETLSTVTLNGNTEDEETTIAFTNPIEMQNDEQVARLHFEITNNSPYSSNTDIIIDPSITNNDIDDVIMTWYYSVDNTTYKVYAGEYLVVHKGTPMHIELRILATQNLFGVINFKDSVSIDIHSEMDTPDDFEYEHEITYSETNPYTTKKCPTCGHLSDVEYLQNDDIVIINDEYIDAQENYTCNEDFDNKYIFLEIMSSGKEIYFSGKLTNVTISTLLALQGSRINISANSKNVTLRQIIFNRNGTGPNVIDVQNCSNIKIIDCTFNYCGDLGFFSGVNGLLLKDCTFYGGVDTSYSISDASDVKIIDTHDDDTTFKFYFAGIKNLVYDSGTYHMPIFQNISGEVYIINSNSYESVDFASFNNANVYIENNSSHRDYYITIQPSSNTTISMTNNYSYDTYTHRGTYKIKNPQEVIRL